MTRSRHTMTRRQWLSRAGSTAAALALLNTTEALYSTPTTGASSAASSRRYKVAASDWMLLKRQKPGALPICKDAGLNGVEVDMGPLGKRPTFENNLRQEEFRTSYLAAARENGLEIASLAMSAFYGQPVADHPKAQEFAAEWIDLMGKMGTKVGFVPVIFRKEDDAKAAAEKVVALFKRVGPMAEKASVVVGLNTQLDAAGNNKLLDDIGSPAVKIAYNIGEAVDAQRDVYVELGELGGERIAQIIPTLSDGKWLQDDERIDVPKLKSQLDEMNWSGWLILQRSRVGTMSVRENFAANAKYLKSIFQAA